MTRTPKPLPRKLHMPSGVWSYKVGGTGVRIRTPDCLKTVYVPADKLLGEDMDDIYYARRWRRLRYDWVCRPQNSDNPFERPELGDITPAKVWQYVACHLAGTVKPKARKARARCRRAK
jgi:hypothetical protein